MRRTIRHGNGSSARRRGQFATLPDNRAALKAETLGRRPVAMQHVVAHRQSASGCSSAVDQWRPSRRRRVSTVAATVVATTIVGTAELPPPPLFATTIVAPTELPRRYCHRCCRYLPPPGFHHCRLGPLEMPPWPSSRITCGLRYLDALPARLRRTLLSRLPGVGAAVGA